MIVPILIVVALVICLGFAIWWLFFETEGIYLGKKIVVWLYDVYATRYDNIKGNEDVDEHIFLAAPLMVALRPHENPLVLDMATGTGRIPLALSQHARFDGFIVALDLSRKMIAKGAEKIQENHFTDFVQFVWANGQSLPFNDNQFDLVTCMESLEFMPNPQEALQELLRVLRPSGILLTTLRWNAKWIPSIWTEEQMRDYLERFGAEKIEVQPWQMDYKLVWAYKKGQSDFVGAQPLEEILRCPKCQSACMVQTDTAFQCPKCHASAPIGQDGVVELAPLQ